MSLPAARTPCSKPVLTRWRRTGYGVADFAAAVFTNLTRDHLDFHQTFESYFAAKRRLFEGTGAGAPAAGIVNLDDPYGAQLAGLAGRTITYGLAKPARRSPRNTSRFLRAVSTSWRRRPPGKIEVHSPLVGRINVYNLLAAIATAVALDIPRTAIEAGIQRLQSRPRPLRAHRSGAAVPGGRGLRAHRRCIAQSAGHRARIAANGRIITLFGCGGDRDRSKRPLMGEAAGRNSDVVVLTSDNPRNEDPLYIINDSLVGLQRTPATVLVEPDRAARHRTGHRSGACRRRRAAGRQGPRNRAGSEAGSACPFDDREMARQALRARGYGG